MGRRSPLLQPLSPVRLPGGLVVLRGVLLPAGFELPGQRHHRPAHGGGVIERRRRFQRGQPGERGLRHRLGRWVRLSPRGSGTCSGRRSPVAGRRARRARFGRARRVRPSFGGWCDRSPAIANSFPANCRMQPGNSGPFRPGAGHVAWLPPKRASAGSETSIPTGRYGNRHRALRRWHGMRKTRGNGVIEKRLSPARREAPHHHADRADSGRQGLRLSRPARLIRRPVRRIRCQRQTASYSDTKRFRYSQHQETIHETLCHSKYLYYSFRTVR